MTVAVPICTNYPSAFTLYYHYSHGCITHCSWSTWKIIAYVSTWIFSVGIQEIKIAFLESKVLSFCIKTPGWLFTLWKSAFKKNNPVNENIIKPKKTTTKQNQSTMFYTGPKDTGVYAQLSSVSILSKGQLKEMQNELWESGSFSYTLMNSKEKAGQKSTKLTYLNQK